jgi:deoxyribonucleoside regulator
MVIRHLINSLRPRRLRPELTVVPFTGFIDITGPSYAAAVLAWDLARVYGARAFFLPGEAYIPDRKLKEQLEKLPGIRQALESLRKADLILTGIGDPKKNNLESRARRLCFSEKKMRRLKELIQKLESQLVGEIAGQPFDPQGQPFPKIEELFGSILGLTLSELAERVKRGATSIGIVGGDLSRVPGIVAAIRARYINVLITDNYTARTLVQYAG